MSIIKHPFLHSLSKLVEQERTSFRWIDLYAAQFIADSFSNKTVEIQPIQASGGMGDLFDELPEQLIAMNEVDIIVLALMCSQVNSQGQTHLNLSMLPHDLMASAKACGYRPSFRSTQELLDGLMSLEQERILRVVGCSAGNNNQGIPLDDEITRDESPLILWQDKLYLAKYWSLHQTFESWLQSRSEFVEHVDNDLLLSLSSSLKQVFSIDEGEPESEVNWQAVSAAHTLLSPFSLITGGPGTGKTTTVASLLFLLMHKRERQIEAQIQGQGTQRQLREKLHVRLLAPTGKAAVKLADSIRQHLKQIEKRLLGNDVKRLRMSDCLPETGETVHRFLHEMGGLRDSFQRPKRFKGDEVLIKRSNQTQGGTFETDKKPLDVVIVDESSMMDLALMVELVSLIPPTTQLILLGDHYQLPAVDPGQVFTECVQRFSQNKQSAQELSALSLLTTYSETQLTAFEEPSFRESDLGFQALCSLRKTFRFGGELKVAADQIKAGEVHTFKKQFWCASEQYQANSAVTWYDAELSNVALNGLPDYRQMVKAYSGYFDMVAKGAPLNKLAEQFERFQLLCSTLEGPLGVHFINTYIEQHFHSACFPKGKLMGELYHGKAILVTRNHPHLGIYNGDIGFVIEDTKTANLNVHFPIAHHEAIVIPPARIKVWQTAYAMTVHKSQGSEYQHVGVVLADYAKELLSRPLLYTALTRSKNQCEMWAGNDVLNKAFEV